MNLNNPDREELRRLIGQCDDRAGNHVLWVTRSGEVKISRTPLNGTEADFQQAQTDVQLRYETFLAGNEYVGPEAAVDESWVAELYDSLLREWQRAQGMSGVARVDLLGRTGSGVS